MSKYIEELEYGDCFILNNSVYILTTDIKADGRRLCVSLKEGTSRWIKSEEIVEKIAIFYTDIESNIISIKETKKDDPYQN